MNPKPSPTPKIEGDPPPQQPDGADARLPFTSMEEALEALQTDPQTGLSEAEARKRLEREGFNEVTQKKTNPLTQFLKNFWGLSAWMLELIIILSAILGKFENVAVVSVLLLANALISAAQERRTSKALDLLREQLQVSARVQRNRRWQSLPARELAPGDIIRLRMGDLTPADVMVIKGSLLVDQSALTGESLHIMKSAGDTLFSGSIVRSGEGNCLVARTGARTVFGRTAELVQLASPKLHIESVVQKIVQWLFVIISVMIGIVTFVTIYRGQALVEIIPLLLVMLMSAVPVALPVIFTVSLARGSTELAAHGVLVTRLSATEDAAVMDVLCVDKTGTLTENRMTITRVVPMENSTETEVIISALLASKESNNDPIDSAFFALADELGISAEVKKINRLAFIPFNTINRRTEAIYDQEGYHFHVMKGAVETLAAECNLNEEETQKVNTVLKSSQQSGRRSLAIARGIQGGKLKMIGLVTLSDPLRKDAKTLIDQLTNLGISVKMLTGDAVRIAREIGVELGLNHIRSMRAISAESGTQASVYADLLEGADGLAGVFPEDKFRVVQQLQQAGHIVGMTGDGVNDAPALRQAEVGIAVRSATDVAKSAASVALTEDGLTPIITLVQQGRCTHQRILTWLINKISRTILKSGFVAITYLITGEFAVSAFAMLLMTLLNDSAKIAIATDNVRASQRPETWEINGFIAIAVLMGVLMTIESILFSLGFLKTLASGLPKQSVNTVSFLTLLYMAIFSIISIRERRSFWSSMPSRTLLLALAADLLIGTSLAFIGIPGLAPLPFWLIAMLFGVVMTLSLTLNDRIKVLLVRWLAPAAV